MRPVEGAPNPMQRLSRFPATPYLSPLRRRKLHIFPLGHRHHLGRKIYIRWCCIDLLNAPELPGVVLNLRRIARSNGKFSYRKATVKPLRGGVEDSAILRRVLDNQLSLGSFPSAATS